MKLPKRNFPKNYIKQKCESTSARNSLPFFIKECGYSNDKKFSVGKNNNYDEFIILYPLSGIVRFSKNHSTLYVQPNNVIVSACNAPLTFTQASKNWRYLYIVFQGTHAKRYYNMLRTSTSVIPCSPLTSIIDYLLDAVTIKFDGETYDDIRAGLIVHNILFELFVISQNIIAARVITPVQETVVIQSLKYIATNYMKELNVDIICEEVSFSKFYFCKLFKEHTGQTVHQYLSEFRVNKSKELLTYSKLSINAIATSVGFHNTLTYSRAFKNFLHMTPSEYRKNF
ncbi:MAG: AraC family transcriptional regulator [Lachnospiraceae bacterium]|nr:AraC family transcriptional regulator [Lachnospiraceae bacterium]